MIDGNTHDDDYMRRLRSDRSRGARPVAPATTTRHTPGARRPLAALVALGLLVVLPCLPGCARNDVLSFDGPPDRRWTGTFESQPAPSLVPLNLADGEVWLFRLTQIDADARIDVRAADGRLLFGVQGPARGGGSEWLFWEASAPRRAQLEIRSVRPAAAAGRWVLNGFRFRSGPGAELARGLRELTMAGRWPEGATLRPVDVALAQYGSAESIFRRLGHPVLAAEVALQLAGLHYNESQAWQATVLAATRAVRSNVTSLDDIARNADALALEGAARIELERGAAVASTSRAAEALDEAYVEALRANRLVAAAQARILRSALDYQRGSPDAALLALDRASDLLRTAGAPAEQRAVAINLAALRADRGDYAGAVREYEAILQRTSSARDEGRGALLQNLATIHFWLGNNEQALALLSELQALAQDLRNDDLAARAALGLGLNHAQLGQLDLALGYLEESVDLRRRRLESEPLALALVQLGSILQQRGDFRRALAVQREALTQIDPGALPVLRARMLIAQSTSLAAIGNAQDAWRIVSEALSLSLPDGHFIRGRALTARARASRLRGMFAPARQDAAEAASIAARLGNREDLIAALFEGAQVEVAAGDRSNALALANAAIVQIEQLPAGSENPDNRATLNTRLREPYDLRVNLLAEDAMRLGTQGSRDVARDRIAEALRATLRQSTVARAEQPDSVRDVSGRESDSLYTDLAARSYRLETLAERARTPTPTMRALEREIARLRTRVAVLSPALRGPRQRESATMVEQPTAAVPLRTDLPSGSVTLVYWVGPKASWMWSLAGNGAPIELRRLPPGRELAAAVSALQQAIRDMASAVDVDRAAKALERLVLPTTSARGGSAEWRIVADGPLTAVPWPLLASRAQATSAVLLTGSSALFAPGRTAIGPQTLPKQTPTSNDANRVLRLALIGDPQFGNGEPPLAPLPGAARELSAIAQIAGKRVVVDARGFTASRDAVWAADSSRVDVLHLATHALLDQRTPELAAIVMARVDRTGRRIVGELRARDLPPDWRSPPLVVLSACDTAAEPTGDAAGLTGLVRAFVLADAKYVVASLWPVSDAGVVELMTDFYQGLLDEGLPAATALSRAQSRLATHPRWGAPFFWAGFTLTEAATG
jgi:CHAT domain-containing protein